MLTKSGDSFVWHLSTDCIFGGWKAEFEHKPSLFGHIHTHLGSSNKHAFVRLLLLYHVSSHKQACLSSYITGSLHQCCLLSWTTHNLHHDPDIISSLSLVLLPVFSWLVDCWQVKEFLCADVEPNFRSDPQVIIGSPRDHLNPWLPLDLGWRNPAKGQNF